jgi:osmotically-inducible protein OsmY
MRKTFVATVGLFCTFAAGGAWADVASTSGDAPNSKQVASEILRDAAVGPYGVRVRATRDGVVHLTGSVVSIRDWNAAEAAARDASGVTGVQNGLSILVR